MSKGDSHFGIECSYKGIKMRSKFETEIAFMLDKLNIIWEYEPILFKLSNGIFYKPDFYLPELKMWIEVKGVLGENNIKISHQFVKDNKTTLILWNYDQWIWFSYGEYGFYQEDDDKTSMDDGVQIGFCSHCKSYFFTGLYGSWHCRKCGNHEGDHDILGVLSGSEIYEKCNIDINKLYDSNKT